MIHGEEHVKFGRFRCRKKLPILQSSQSSITGCLTIVTGQAVPEPHIDSFVDQDAHLGTREQKMLCFFECGDSRFARDCRGPIQKVFDAFSAFQVVKERLDGNSRSTEHRGPFKNLRLRFGVILFGLRSHRMPHAA